MGTGTLTIDLAAIAANWRKLDRLSVPEVQTAAVVKADAYGLGLKPVSTALAAAGARSFFVAVAEEGAALRAHLGPAPQIFVFSGAMAQDHTLIADNALIPLLNSPAQVANHLAHLPGNSYGLQIDSGMNRLGIEPADIAALPTLNPVLIISHMACADDPDHAMNARQLDTFRTASQAFPGVQRSLAATGGTLLGPDYHFDLTRPGVGLYGGLPFADASPVVTLDIPVIQTRQVATGEPVGYGNTWIAERPGTIATISAGYADGLPRALSQVSAYAGDTACPVVGRISMDLITVDVTDLAYVPDSLALLNAHQTIDDLATHAGTIGYEILTSLGPRYNRRYRSAP